MTNDAPSSTSNN